MAQHYQLRPIIDAVKSKSWVPAVGGLVLAAVTLGFLSTDQAMAINGITMTMATAFAGLVPIVTSLVHAFSAAGVAEKKVTPVANPRDNSGAMLVPEGSSMEDFELENSEEEGVGEAEGLSEDLWEDDGGTVPTPDQEDFSDNAEAEESELHNSYEQ